MQPKKVSHYLTNNFPEIDQYFFLNSKFPGNLKFDTQFQKTNTEKHRLVMYWHERNEQEYY